MRSSHSGSQSPAILSAAPRAVRHSCDWCKSSLDRRPLPRFASRGWPDASPGSRCVRERRGCLSLGPPPPISAPQASAPGAGPHGAVHGLGPAPESRPPPVRARPRSRTPWFHSRRANGPAPHAHRAPCWWPPFFRARRLVVSPDAGAIEKRHPELNPALLGQEQQPLPHAQVVPADEHLRRAGPGPQLSGDGPPLGSILMAPEDGRDGAPQILRLRLTLGPTRLDQRLQVRPLRVRHHRPLLIPEGAKRPSSQTVQARTGPRLVTLNFPARLSSHRSADVGAQLVQVRAGVLKVPASQAWLLRRNHHCNEDESAEKREKKHDEPHHAFPTWGRCLAAKLGWADPNAGFHHASP